MEVQKMGLFVQERNKEQRTMAKKKQTHRTQIQTSKNNFQSFVYQGDQEQKIELVNIINFI